MDIGRQSPGGAGWGAGGIGMAFVTIVQLALAGLVVGRHTSLGGAQIVAASAAAIVSVMLLALASIPRGAKASLIGLLCAAAMAVISTQDPFGMRAVKEQVATAMGKAPSTIITPSQTGRLPKAQGNSRVTIRTIAASDDGDFAPDLAQQIEQGLSRPETGGIRVNGAADVDVRDQRLAYSVTWSVADRGVSRWCGRIAATTPSRMAAVRSLAAIITRSADHIADGGTTCS